MSAAVMIPVQFKRAEDSAPQHPPCFESQSQWVEYVAWSLAAHDTAVKPLLEHRARRQEALGGFNPKFNFCVDCTARRRTAMKQADRCNPTWVAELAQAERVAA